MLIYDEVRAIESLRVDPKNARRHTDHQIKQIIASVQAYGYVEKIVIRPDGQIIAGEGRLRALQHIGIDNVEVRVAANGSEAQYIALGLALNRIAENSSWDDDRLRELVAAIDDDGGNLAATGFSEKELGSLLGEPDAIEVKTIETTDVEDVFWISIKGPLASQAHALARLQEVMREIPDVEVELGTIATGE
jgi:ParB-like chromosome segregation protein Spo0J